MLSAVDISLSVKYGDLQGIAQFRTLPVETCGMEGMHTVIYNRCGNSKCGYLAKNVWFVRVSDMASVLLLQHNSLISVGGRWLK